MKLNKILYSMAASILLLSSCDNKIIKIQLPTPDINSLTYDGQTLQWSTVTNATSYLVKIDSVEVPVNSSSYKFTRTSDFSVALKALTTDKFYIESSWSPTITINFLGDVTNISVSDGSLVWGKVTNASSYEVLNVETNHVSKVNNNSFSNFTAGDSHTFKIRAKGDGKTKMDGKWSLEFSFRILLSPANFTYNRQTDLLTWSAVDGAEGYELTVNGDVTSISKYATSVSFIPDSNTSYFEIKIGAVSTSANNVFSSSTSSLIIERLAQVKVSSIEILNSSTNESTISFDEVPNALSYMVKVDGSEISKQNNGFYHVFSTGNSTLEFTAIAPLSFQEINGLKYYFLDSHVTAFEVTKLSAPTNIRIQDGSIMWDASPSATSYELLINGSSYVTSLTSYKIPNLSAGEHTVNVRAKGNSNGVIQSNFGIEANFTKLPRVALSTFSHDGYVVKWGAISGATSYEVLVNDELESVNVNFYTISSSDISNLFKISVVAKGNGLNLTDSEMSDTFALSRLSTPINFKINEEGMITWNAVPNVVRYVISINQTLYETSSTNFNANALINPDENFVIYIYAVANSEGSYLNSSPSDAISGARLATPKNLRIENNLIVWDQVNYAYQYQVTLNGVSHYVTTNSFAPLLTEVKTANTFTVRAIGKVDTVGNLWFINSAVSQVFSWESKKLSTPTNIQVSVTETTAQISWNKVSGAESYQVQIGGVVYPSATELLEFERALVGSYEIVVKALGNKATTIDSSFSTKKTISFLGAPVVTTSRNQDDSYLIKWNAIQNATKYRIRKTVTNADGVSAVTISEISSNNTMVTLFTETGNNYKLEIQALGNDYDMFDSVYSSPVFVRL